MFGAAGGIRTLKLSPADFKSAVYAVPPRPRGFIICARSARVKKGARCSRPKRFRHAAAAFGLPDAFTAAKAAFSAPRRAFEGHNKSK